MQVKKFIFRAFVFAIIAFPLVALSGLYAWYTHSYEHVVNGNEIYTSLRKSKVRKKVKKLLIGDSVGKQLYDNETWNGDIYSLTCNQAISMAGQYILLHNFIDNNQGQLPQEVLLIITPGSFFNNLDQVYTYHYFLKPFYTSANAPLLSPVAMGRIRKVPYYYTAQWPLIVNSDWSPTYDSQPDEFFTLLSSVSVDYLIKIRQLCAKEHIRFAILSPPARRGAKVDIESYAKDEKGFAKSGLKAEFKTYFNNIEYMPDSLFQDEIHFKKPYIPKDYFGLEQ